MSPLVRVAAQSPARVLQLWKSNRRAEGVENQKYDLVKRGQSPREGRKGQNNDQMSGGSRDNEKDGGRNKRDHSPVSFSCLFSRSDKLLAGWLIAASAASSSPTALFFGSLTAAALLRSYCTVAAQKDGGLT